MLSARQGLATLKEHGSKTSGLTDVVIDCLNDTGLGGAANRAVKLLLQDILTDS